MAGGSAPGDRALGVPRWTATTTVLWSIMMLLATSIAGYGFWLLASPSVRPPFLHSSPVPLAELAHFSGAALALLLGPWQFITGRSGRRSRAHVWSGRVYLVAVLVGAGCIAALR